MIITVVSSTDYTDDNRVSTAEGINNSTESSDDLINYSSEDDATDVAINDDEDTKITYIISSTNNILKWKSES